MSLLKEITLDNIADGVALELFQHEMKKIARNIADQNTSPTTKRKVTLTFEFTPDEMRDEAKVHVSAKTTLAPTKGHTKTVWCGKKNGEAQLYGQDQKQIEMFDDGVTAIGAPNHEIKEAK
jgi:hypothetical protein